MNTSIREIEVMKGMEGSPPESSREVTAMETPPD
jgi:hypothetical protein